MIRKPSSGVAPVFVNSTSAVAMASPGLGEPRIAGVRIVGVAIVRATTFANNFSFEPK